MRVLVYGFYGKANLGDELFKDALRHLFPELALTFVDRVTVSALAETDVVFIGGGSLLDGPISIEKGAWPSLEGKPVVYIGVGSETALHPDHERLLRSARAVVLRNRVSVERFASAPVVVAPDLVYALDGTHEPATNRRERSVLVLPNALLLPTATDPHWRYAAWEYARTEISQALDVLIERGFTITFLALSRNDKLHDDWAATEILSRMKYRNAQMLGTERPTTYAQALDVLGQHSTVITQRFHGRVLADLAHTPCVTISHHDKLNGGNAVSYWGITKAALLRSFEGAMVGVPAGGHDDAVRLVREVLSRCPSS